jgi:hypothetical protein
VAGTGAIQQCAVAGAGKREHGRQGRHEHRECNAVLPSRHLSGPVAQTERSADAVPPRTEPITRSGPYGATSLELSSSPPRLY